MPRVSPPYSRVSLGSVTLSGTNESLRVKVPSSVSVPLLQARFMTGKYPPNEVWVPLGLSYIITTGITVTAGVVTLWMNGVACTGTGAAATLPIASSGADEIFVPFGNYVLPAAPGIGDAWSVKVTTTSTAGVVNPVYLWYITKPVAGITEGVTL